MRGLSFVSDRVLQVESWNFVAVEREYGTLGSNSLKIHEFVQRLLHGPHTKVPLSLHKFREFIIFISKFLSVLVLQDYVSNDNYIIILDTIDT